VWPIIVQAPLRTKGRPLPLTDRVVQQSQPVIGDPRAPGHLECELAVRRLVCEPRLGMRARLWLDMTTDEEVQRNLPRLITALREPAVP
jgi:hypothetical protein